MGSQTLFQERLDHSGKQFLNVNSILVIEILQLFSHKSSVQRSSTGPLLPETEIWSIIMQLTAGLRAIHQCGLACRFVNFFFFFSFRFLQNFVSFFLYYLLICISRLLDPTKIIITGKRIRFSFLGISDIISYEPTQTSTSTITQHYQQVRYIYEPNRNKLCR